MSINDIKQKIKWQDVYRLLVIILVISLVFGLFIFYLDSKNIINRHDLGGITIDKLVIDSNTADNLPVMTLVGSKTGKKYHLLTCSGAKRIADHNKIWFASAIEAEKLGYTPASNCPGLK